MRQRITGGTEQLMYLQLRCFLDALEMQMKVKLAAAPRDANRARRPRGGIAVFNRGYVRCRCQTMFSSVCGLTEHCV